MHIHFKHGKGERKAKGKIQNLPFTIYHLH